MAEFFGRAVAVAWHLALGVSFRAISLPENFITNGELSSLFRGEAHASSRAQFGAASSALSVTGLRPQRLHAKRSVRRMDFAPCLSFFAASPLLVSVNLHHSYDIA